MKPGHRQQKDQNVPNTKVMDGDDIFEQLQLCNIAGAWDGGLGSCRDK